MNLRALRSLVAIQDSKSFVEAAQRLKINQSAISMQIKALEEELQVALFDRSVRPPVMTPTGIAIARSAREILELLEGIRETAENTEALTGSLMLGCIPTATIGFLPNVLQAINRRYPGIHMRVQSALSEPLVEGVQHGTLDAAIVTEPAKLPAGLRSEIIMRERLALISAFDAGTPPTIEAILDANFIRFNRHAGVGRIIGRFLASRRIEPDEFMELDSIEAIIEMVERGIGIAIVPERPLESYRQRVAIRPLEGSDAQRNVSLIFAETNANVPLLEAILALFRQASGQG
ncbi:LysR substrate-binding domain-containing protein [Hansschlegelia beijingensis]|uniref:DNA-binding transcriptional LysR family regulator n=1 Tax=Hansschlegelia beijingensis TaxID=1133344 RepID=A0A7W6CYC9_9HYPH|nr:DNA-binding transcriptional LysR family regulator [Hansschlegelia beijingensis]